MKTFNSVIYGDIPQPENFNELVDLISNASNYENIVHMWRGQSNIGWRLDHSAYRRLKLENRDVSERSLEHYEENLLAHATHKGYRFQEGKMLSDFELLAKLQHHGAATRLIDFSRNALIALWFCVCENPQTTGLLIGLNAEYLGGYESLDIKVGYTTQVKLLKEIEHPATFEPPVVTPRVAAQHSQFIYSSLTNSSRGCIKLHSNTKANLFIAISPDLKNRVEDILEKCFDLRYYTLFPDIDGFGKANSHLILRNRMFRW